LLQLQMMMTTTQQESIDGICTVTLVLDMTLVRSRHNRQSPRHIVVYVITGLETELLLAEHTFEVNADVELRYWCLILNCSFQNQWPQLNNIVL
jgi:hypothetical protein